MKVSVVCHGPVKPLANPDHSSTQMDHTCSRAAALYGHQNMSSSSQNGPHREPSLDSYHLNRNGFSYYANERHGADSSNEGLSSSTQLSEEEPQMTEVNQISFDVMPAAIRVKPDIDDKQCMDQSVTSSGPFESYSYSRSRSRSPPKPCRDVNIAFEAESAYPAVCISECHCTGLQRSGKNSPTLRHVPHPTDGRNCSRIRLMCSFGGRIMPRSVDGKLRYGGGETRIIAVNRDMDYQEFMWKMSQFYGTPVVLKYQLPGEDLDALVSVSSDEDLQNMVDEYDRLESSGGLSRLRLFFFTSPSEYDAGMSDVGDGHINLNQQYVNAVNGIPDKLSGFHLEDGLDTVLSPMKENGSRVGHDVPNIRVGFPGTKHFSRAPSAPSSSPSSPSVASALRLSGMGDAVKEHPSIAAYSHAVENKSQAIIQDGCTDVTSPFCCDHQHHLPPESLRVPYENVLSRGKSYQIPKTGGVYGVDTQAYGLDTQANLIHPSEHLGDHVTEAGLINSWHDVQPSPDTAFFQTGFQCNLHMPKKVPPHTSPPGGHVQVGCNAAKNETIQHCPLDMHTLQHSPSSYHQNPHRAHSHLHHSNHCCVHQQPMSSHHEHASYVQPHVQAHSQVPLALSGTTSYKIGSAPSSPRVAISEHSGKCSCHQQYSQVHRGINVSLGEPPHSNRTRPFVDQYLRKPGPICSSRFCDSPSHCGEKMGWQHQPIHFAGIEGDYQQKHLENSWQQHDANSPRQMVDYHAAGHPFHYCDPPAFAETLLSSHDLHEKYANRCCCLNCSEQRKQYVEKPGHSVYMEQQDQIGDHAVHQLISVPLDEARVFGSGRSPFSKDEIFKVESGAESHLEGGVEGELELSGPGEMPILHHAQSHLAGQNINDCYSKSASFSSTTALAGSWPMLPTDHEDWPDYRHNDMSGHVGESPASTDPRVVTVGINIHIAGPNAKTDEEDAYSRTSATPDRMVGSESTTKLLSLSTTPSSLDASCDKAHSSSHDVIQNCSSPSIHVASTSSNCWQHYPQNSLSMTALKDTPSTLAFPLYDQSLSSSSNTLNFCFEPRDEMGAKAGSDINQQAFIPTGSLMVDGNILSIAGASSKLRESGNSGSDGEMPNVKHEALKESTVEEDCTRATVALDSSTGKGSGAMPTDANVENVRMNQECSVGSRVTNEVIHEETNAELGKECMEEPEEFPVSRAEAEAIARGLQIIKNDDLEDLRELGSGTYGTVFHGKWRGSDVAIKRIKASCFDGPPSMQERLISDFWREAGTLSQLHHPNVVAFYGVVPDGPGGTLATVTEYMVNGSLRQVLQKKDRTIDRKKRFLIAMDAAFGMEYLHSKNIVHFDLKSENLLVNMRDAHRPICKVGDFGLSKVKHQTLVSGGVRGTLPWMAPELLNGNNSRVTEKVDVYSFGIVMWELLTGEEPYANMHCGAIIGGIVNNTLRPPIPSWCDPGWRTLMERCWSGDPADRPLFSEVVRDLRGMAATMNVK